MSQFTFFVATGNSTRFVRVAATSSSAARKVVEAEHPGSDIDLAFQG
jgi:hypothetical protein